MSPLPQTMNCVEISTPGGPEVLKPATRPTPVPADGEVLIKVAAAEAWLCLALMVSSARAISAFMSAT